MFKQVGIGAAAVLTIGLLAAGCSDGDTTVAGAAGFLNNTDTTPFSGVTSNNLANDGGGFTPNGANHTAWRVVFNCDSPKSDGTFSGDSSAIVLFSTSNNRVYASHFASGKFTPPVELEASDRDYTAPINLNSYVLMPLNTGNYQSGATGTPAAEVNTVRQNAGNWVIIGEFLTKFTTPGQLISSATPGKGARRTIGSWVFLTAERTKSFSTSNRVGGLTREFRYGFQRNADEIPTANTSGAIGTAPANNVMSYGVASDGLAGQASFGGNGTPSNGGVAIYSVTTPTYDSAIYTAGEDVSCLAAVYTQVETTLSSTDLRRSSLDASTSDGGQAFLRQRPFNLATLTWGTESRITTGIHRHTGADSTEMGEGVFPDFNVYNNTVFYRYMDASMLTNSSGFGVNTLSIQASRTMIAATRFIDGNNGTCTINTVGAGNALDVSTDTFCVSTSGAGVPGAHTTTESSFTTAVGPANPTPSRESASFLTLVDGDSQTQSIYGSDEGLGDLSMFFTQADGTASGTGTTGSGPNSDAELSVVGLSNSGALATSSFVAGTNPLRISGNHATDNQANTSSASTTNVSLTDAVAAAKFVLNRTGRWIAVAFTRPNGVGENSAFGTDLFGTVYQPFRLVTSTTGGGTGGTAATMQTRVLAAGPSVLSTTLSVNTNFFGNRLPVNAFRFQEKACYRGAMSNAGVVSLFWEQSDGTGDRVFGARLAVTLNGTSAAPAAPTLGTVTAIELVFANNVLGDAQPIALSSGAPGTSSFEWLDGNGRVTNSNHWIATDAGADAGSSTATNGNVLIVFTRVDDATNTDGGSNDDGDVSIYTTTFNGTAFETAVKIGTTADTNEVIAGIATSNNIKIDTLVCLPRNTDITNKPNFPTNSDTGYFVVLFKDREASLTAAASATTTTVVPGNSTSRLAQFARRISFVNSTKTPAVTAIADRIFPSINNTATSPFALPSQLDHAQGVTTDAGQIDVCQNSTGLAVVFVFDNQIWYQATQDGENWLRDGSTGLPNPGLISNFSSADTTSFELTCCTDATGDEGAAILTYEKQDLQGTTRGYVASKSN